MRIPGFLSADEWQPPLGGELVQLLLHHPSDVLVHLVGVRIAAEALTRIDRLHRLQRELRRQRPVAEHVADVEAPWDRERDREDLQPEELVQLKRPRQSLTSAQENRRLLASDRDQGDDWDVLLQRQADEALASGEVDLALLPGRPVDLPVAARIDEDRGVALERKAGDIRRCGDP